mmetsp:Transcript_40698/g.128304  ORF Transcript_40698/g.128304 Transcript_40698/m.128304 type:complete len:281 (+) Transcript_40698:185-1027(+)
MKLLRKLAVERLADFQGALGGADAADLHCDGLLPEQVHQVIVVLVEQWELARDAFACFKLLPPPLLDVLKMQIAKHKLNSLRPLACRDAESVENVIHGFEDVRDVHVVVAVLRQGDQQQLHSESLGLIHDLLNRQILLGNDARGGVKGGEEDDFVVVSFGRSGSDGRAMREVRHVRVLPATPEDKGQARERLALRLHRWEEGGPANDVLPVLKLLHVPMPVRAVSTPSATAASSLESRHLSEDHEACSRICVHILPRLHRQPVTVFNVLPKPSNWRGVPI